MAPDGSSSAHSHTRRSVLKTAAGTLSIAAVGSLSGCQGLGGESDSGGESWPVATRLDSVPDGVWAAQYIHVGDLLSDPATSALADAYFARQTQDEDYKGPTTLSEARQQFDEVAPVSIDGLHEIIQFNDGLVPVPVVGAPGETQMKRGTLLWTDWEASAFVDGIEDQSGGVSLIEQTYQGQTMYVPESDGRFAQLFNFGVLGDGRYVFGDRTSVENTIDVVAGGASPVSGTIRDSLGAAPAGPIQIASDVQQQRLQEFLDERPAPPATPGLGPALMVDIKRVFGSLYVDGTTRGVDVTFDAESSDTASAVRAAIQTSLDGARQSRPPEDPLRGVLADLSVTASGSTARLTYETSVSEVEGLAEDLGTYQPPPPTPYRASQESATPNTTLDAPPEVQEYLAGVSNASSVTDHTGQEQVTVQVGAEGNGGAFAFSPPALRIDAGTTVTWEWTGEGGAHNVVADGETLESTFESGAVVAEAGHTFEQTFDSSGVVLYYCAPHRTLGMRGAIIVE
jgi:halocyanin-like protein